MLRSTGFRLFLAAFFVFNLNCRPIPSGDTTPAALLPFRVVQSLSINFDPYAAPLDRIYRHNMYFLSERDGHFYSSYPIAQPLLLAPLYAPIALLPPIRNLPVAQLLLVARILEKIFASAIAAGSVWTLFALLRRLTTPARALLLACAYAFGTNVWATSSQALWQHGASQLAIALSLLFLVRFLDQPTRMIFALAAGFFAALAVALRPTDLLFYAASCGMLLLLFRHRTILASYLGFGVLIAGLLITYNYSVFGSARGWYQAAFSYPIGLGLLGLLLSPGRGLFVYTPIALFVPLGLWHWRNRGSRSHRLIYWIAALFTAGQILIIARWPIWSGGTCYGPRLLSDMLPCLILLLIPALEWMDARRPARAAFFAALAFSIFAQFIGTFSYPKGIGQDRLWLWSECPILTNARAGLLVSHYVTLAVWTNDLLHGRTPDTRGSLNLLR